MMTEKEKVREIWASDSIIEAMHRLTEGLCNMGVTKTVTMHKLESLLDEVAADVLLEKLNVSDRFGIQFIDYGFEEFNDDELFHFSYTEHNSMPKVHEVIVPVNHPICKIIIKEIDND